MTVATTLFKHTSFLRGKRDLLKAIQAHQKQIRNIKKSSSKLLEEVAREIDLVRGRPLFYPAIFSGIGHGALAELVDGSIKYDFITGIGTHYFGHSNLDLIDTAIQAASKNIVMQGNLQLSPEVLDFSQKLLSLAGGKLKHVWPVLSGSMANDNALKIIQQKKSPAYKVVAFQHCFHGRSIAMAQITDNEKYRKGLHPFHLASYIPFYDPADDQSIQKSVTALKDVLHKEKGEIAGFVFELIQGEGGFNLAPREFFTSLMDICQEEKIAIWVDEVQTFARTQSLFAFQTLNLTDYVDVVTVGKMLQNCATLYTAEYNPDPGLIAGTFNGSTVSLTVASHILERLKKEKFFGTTGKIAHLEKWAKKGIEDLQKKFGKETISNISGVGAMWAWQFRDGSMENTKALILKAFEEGVMLFSCGRGPYKVRFLLPAGILTESVYQKALGILSKAIQKL
ncbi:MAG: hypothetical protein A3B70_08080 [Deltaproteobacteria bacterium RIFCSPHIGHO2_02_FULL_40_11]|nr:MAG: hypothetical protein A3B70_08080 [Deltaproteobacteria bacterium RIFCSPHIGHO2_02_FULL_40_11]